MKENNIIASAALRLKAEKLLENEPFNESSKLSENQMYRLIHELQIHQVELELQNEELISAKLQADRSACKYAELYDFSPSGYFTLSRDGEIRSLNLCGSALIGRNRSEVIGSMFGFFVSEETRPHFNHFLEKVFSSTIKETCEVTLAGNDDQPVCVNLCGKVSENGEQCLMTIIDITEQKSSEKALKRKLGELEIYYELAITRERKMIALKSEINLLLEKLGEKLKY